MAEYFGYVERDKPIAVDWSKVTQQITTKLDEAEQKKATETAAALKGSKNIADDIKNLKASNRTSGRNFVGNVGYLLGDVNEQLKLAAQTGQIGAKDLVLQQDALKGQLELFNVWSSDYAKRYAGYEALTNPSPVSQASAALMQSYDFVGNLEPTWEDGQLKFYKYDPNSPTGARIGGNQAKPLSITDLNALTYHNKESVDFNERLKNVTTALKQKLPSTTTSAGGLVQTVDPRLNPNFEGTLRKSAEAEFNSVGSIKAANYLVQTGLNTEVSFDPYDANRASTGTIFLEIDPVTNQPVVVSQQKDAIQQKARDEFYKSLDASFGVKQTQKPGGQTSTKVTQDQNDARDRIRNINNFLTSTNSSTRQTGMFAYAQAIGAEDIDFKTKTINGQEVITEYEIKLPNQNPLTVDLYDQAGKKRSTQEVISDFYSIEKPKPAFSDEWKATGLTNISGDQYKTEASDYFTTDVGKKDTDTEVTVFTGKFGDAVAQSAAGRTSSLSNVLDFSDTQGDYSLDKNLVRFYKEHFKGPRASTQDEYRVPKSITNNHKISTNNNGDLVISIKDKTRFRHSDGNKGITINIPSPSELTNPNQPFDAVNNPYKISSDDHQVILEAVTEALWDTSLKTNGALLGKINDLIDTALPNNNISINQ